MRAILIALVTTCCATPAWAHSFYSAQCCRGNDEGGDCGPVANTTVRVTDTGYLYLPTGETIPFAKALFSPDNRYHACIYPPGHVRCFYAVMGAS